MTAKSRAKPHYFIREAWVLAVIVIALFVIGLIYLNSRTDESLETTTSGSSCDLRLSSGCFLLKRAETNSARIKGLSDRDNMPSNSGMLFDFESPSEQCMWMKDMRFNLDILWLNEKKEIIKIEQNVSPQTYPKTFCANKTKYVLEFNQGIVQSSGLKTGDRLKF